MANFLEIVEFFGFYRNCDGKSDEEIIRISDITEEKFLDYKKKLKKNDLIKKIIKKIPEISINNLIKKTKINNIEFHLKLIEVIDPGSIKFSQLSGSDRIEFFKKDKIDSSINYFLSEGYTDNEIAGILKINTEEVYIAKKNLPANITIQTDDIRKQKRIETFFALYPYSTAKDASIALNTTVREIKLFIDALKKQGKVIKANDAPRPLEAEQLKLEIIKLKNEKPSYSNKDISNKLGCPVTLVSMAISDAIRVLQLEKAESYEFYTAKMLSDLDEIEDEAWLRHKASPASSSRWMELVLMAKEKQISILGLKAPERLNINKNVSITKAERDSIVEAYMESEIHDAEYENIEITGMENEE